MEGLRRVFTQGVRLRGADQSKCKGESSQKKNQVKSWEEKCRPVARGWAPLSLYDSGAKWLSS